MASGVPSVALLRRLSAGSPVRAGFHRAAAALRRNGKGQDVDFLMAHRLRARSTLRRHDGAGRATDDDGFLLQGGRENRRLAAVPIANDATLPPPVDPQIENGIVIRRRVRLISSAESSVRKG